MRWVAMALLLGCGSGGSTATDAAPAVVAACQGYCAWYDDCFGPERVEYCQAHCEWMWAGCDENALERAAVCYAGDVAPVYEDSCFGRLECLHDPPDTETCRFEDPPGPV